MLILVLFLAACSLSTPSFTTNTSPPSGTTDTPNENMSRPKEITFIFPAEQQVTCPESPIMVGLLVNDAMRTGGEFNRYKVALKLDGQTITQDALFEVITGGAGLAYHPSMPLTRGQHEAVFSFPNESGTMQTYAWKFEVQDVACPTP